ncbi:MULTISPECIES: type I-B CRISPR-associated endonuclease Cas1b [Thermoanaerobacter]|uniref:CRISPR-associated endonuclease Cas1 n=3 Tax=Thermoanaerobacter TaxID=1754 RepID=B0KBC8_THEP3|nr:MULTISPECIES: type I-B CRISPR-associated endonuclease Cas1b [Thermoanaerobacter]ABY93807.1 CRISPR-associated protein Cas1 [Thermoanaerobacter pseudethanolicus ATCC 33223]ADV78769.1 CRISPR-associated protein Cas1 [Thermoanaerobacter brockii subsp. finnii Ako-1]EMT39589.1 CRISPR-associated endonuclease Cas1 [Thermoanaerobacter thermohydrosulfuricus WC1]UZQ82907.1 type I-B CRISPR-associated endonuclease Cas1b [Thermoanaerobacter sp. RKWS2]HBW59574.1 type I-B CRISPR-associated endonuclease Cas1
MKKTIYIFSDGELKRKDNTLFFEGENGRKFIPVENTSEIMVFGEVSLNKRLLEFLTQSEIILHFFNHYGYYVGSYYPREHLNSGYMILRQAEHYNDESKRLYLAQKFVEGAYKNIRQVLKYYSNRGKDLEDVIYSIEKLGESVDSTSTINELMAIEGNIREYYYKAFDEIIQNPDFKFDFRSKRPPQNFLNTLISFGNSLMYTTTLSEIYKTHLDPRIGFLHATNFRRFSLNLDVSEIFKPIIVDRTIFTLLSKKMVTKEDFEEDAEGLLLKEKGKKVFVQEFEDKLATTIKHRNLSNNVSYRRLIRLELYKLEKHLIEEEQYKPFIAQW